MGAVYCAIDRLSGNEVALKHVNVPAKKLDFATFHSIWNSASDEESLEEILSSGLAASV
jgi:hypothetical protein